MTPEQESIAEIFNEWNKRYAADPDSFSQPLDEEGNPVSNYGDVSALYFTELAEDLGIKINIPK